jgi:plastocyanin
MSIRLPWLVLAALLFALAGTPVEAQAPEPQWSAQLTGSLPAQVNPDSVVPVTLQLAIEGSTFVCAQEQTLTVELSAEGGEPGVILEVPAQLNFTVPQGQYLAASWGESGDVSARLLVSRLAEQGKGVQWNVTATVVASDLSCLPESADAVGILVVNTTIAVVAEPEAPINHPSHEEHGGFDAYLKPGESFSFKFEDAGIYPYHDHLDPRRVGSVHVDVGQTAAKAATVLITDKGYEPNNVTIRAGGTVTWTNNHNQTRTVSLDELHGVEETDPHEHETEHSDAKKSPGLPPAILALGALAASRLRRR